MTFPLFADNPETHETNFLKRSKQLIKIYEKSVLIAIKMETRKTTQKTVKNNGTC